MEIRSESQGYQLYRRTLKKMAKAANRRGSLGIGSLKENKAVQGICDSLLQDFTVGSHVYNNGASDGILKTAESDQNS